MIILYHLQVFFHEYNDIAFLYAWYEHDRLDSSLVSCNFGVTDIENRL